jgi:tetratricopeptide (TPR) repeat protein
VAPKELKRPNLRRARTDRGDSLNDVAAALHELAIRHQIRREVGVDGPRIHSWETGKSSPGDLYVWLLCRHYDKSAAELDLSADWSWNGDPRDFHIQEIGTPSSHLPKQLSSTSPVARSLSPAVIEGVDDVLRRQFLLAAAGLLIDPDLMISLHQHRTLDASTVDYLDLLADRYATDLWSTPTPAIAASLRTHYWQLNMLLSNAPPSSHKARLMSQSAKTALLLGRLARHADNRGDALARWAVAEQLAADAGDQALYATVLVDRSHYYDHRHAASALDEAARHVDSDVHPYLQAWLLTRRARAIAAIGRRTEALTDLDRARTTLSNARIQPTGYFIGWSTHWLSSYEADCAIRLEQYRQAASLLEALLKTSNPAPYHRLALLADLAVAYANEGEIPQSCATLSEAITIATTLQVPQQFQHIDGIRKRHLADQHHEPAVRRLDEQLRAATHGDLPS